MIGFTDGHTGCRSKVGCTVGPGQNNSRVAVCRGYMYICVGPLRFHSFFLLRKNDPRVVARSWLATLARAHTCARPTRAHQLQLISVTVSSFWNKGTLNYFLSVISNTFLLLSRWKMLQLEFQRLLWATNAVDRRTVDGPCLPTRIGFKQSSSDIILASLIFFLI